MEQLFDAGLQQIITQGIWCILFIVMLYITLKNNKERESKYEVILSEQSQSLNLITDTLSRMNEKIDIIDDKVSILEEHENEKGV